MKGQFGENWDATSSIAKVEMTKFVTFFLFTELYTEAFILLLPGEMF